MLGIADGYGQMARTAEQLRKSAHTLETNSEKAN
jgi:hypothetical protein